jgi:hypothetical protein
VGSEPDRGANMTQVPYLHEFKCHNETHYFVYTKNSFKSLASKKTKKKRR